MKKYFSLILTIPWFLLATGAVSHLDNYILFFYCLLISFFIVIFNSIMLNSKLIQPLLKNRRGEFLNNKLFKFTLSIFFIYMLVQQFYLLKSAGFNPQFARNLYFESNSITDIWGSIYIRMIFSYIIMPLFYLYLLNRDRYDKYDIFLISIYILSGLMVGSRFDLYFIVIIYLISRVTSFEYYKIKNKFKYILIFSFLLVVSIGLARSAMSYNLDFFNGLQRSLESIYVYHSIQLGVFGFYSDAPFGLGPFTGITTPFYMIIGESSIESEIYSFLNDVSFSHFNANAFGTSAFFFNFAGYFGFLFFIFSYFSFVAILYTIIHRLYKLLFIRYSLMILFFSAFQPMAFGFAWWFVVFLFIILTLSAPQKLQKV